MLSERLSVEKKKKRIFLVYHPILTSVESSYVCTYTSCRYPHVGMQRQRFYTQVKKMREGSK